MGGVLGGGGGGGKGYVGPPPKLKIIGRRGTDPPPPRSPPPIPMPMRLLDSGFLNIHTGYYRKREIVLKKNQRERERNRMIPLLQEVVFVCSLCLRLLILV